MVTQENPIQKIWAQDASVAAIAKAFDQAARLTRHGRFGPIGPPPIVYIPTVPGRASTVPALRRAPAPPSRPLAARDRIRLSPHAIAGYAAVFHEKNARGDNMISRGAFRDSLKSDRSFYLLRDHRNAADHGALSLASTGAGNLYLEEDRYGLWCEAALADDAEGQFLFGLVERREASGMSWAGTVPKELPGSHGTRIFATIDAWEVSLLFRPAKPAYAQTWVRTLPEARRLRRSFQS